MSNLAARINAPIAWQPTPKQAEFLAAPEGEVLFGGSAGGGKTDALAVDALGLAQAAVTRPAYRAVLFRRSFPELRELIDRTRDIYPAAVPGAIYHESAREWRFPSGAKIEFGYLESDQDRYRYQGRQYAYVGWDELTHWESPVAYEYLLSRNRCPDPAITCYVRATTNPGGIGHEWVRERWRIEDDGGPTRFTLEVGDGLTVKRRFIPARLSDNPYLANTDYRSRLLQLSTMEKRALLEGRWDVIEISGSIYQAEMEWLMLNGRLTDVPYVPGSPVYTFWDLGRSDNMAIWFMQRTGLANRFFLYHQDAGKQLAHYTSLLQRWRDEHRWIYGGHYLPHDIEVTDLSSADNKSRRELLEESGIGEVHVVPRIHDVWEGIEMTRRAFAGCWFDRTGCEEGLKALRNYRRDYDERNQVYRQRPLHNWASNGADAFRQFAQGFTSQDSATGWRRQRRGYMAV